MSGESKNTSEKLEAEQSEHALSEGELLDIIKKAPHGGTEIRPSHHQDLSSDFDLSNIPLEKHSKVKRYLGTIRAYAGGPSMVDNFTNHDDRRAWRQQVLQDLRGKYGEQTAQDFNLVVHNNKVSPNNLARVIASIEMLGHMQVQVPQNEFNKMTDLMRTHMRANEGKSYDKLPRDEKFRIADELSDCAANISKSFERKPAQV